ncbi:MAG: GrpB family protein [Rhodobacteraceae bacterium]|nr:GrpB family protein [Paracoccaceae bacterium]
MDVTLAPGLSPVALSNDLLLYGYHDLGARFREDEVQMTRPAGPGPRTKKRENQELIIAHRLCLCASDCPSPAQRRQFRDALRGDTSLAGRYAALKRDLALKARSNPDWETYNSGKTSFIEGVLSGEGMRLIQR